MKPRLLRRTQFGNPILLNPTTKLTEKQIKSSIIKNLINSMKFTLDTKKYGVGLAANQVGEALAITVINTKPTPTRKDIPKIELVLINPEITKSYGRKQGMWEGCISGTELYAKAMRYKKIDVTFLDEKANKQRKTFEGILAQIIQHEVDHLNGITFIERVKDKRSFKTFSEYRKMLKKEK